MISPMRCSTGEIGAGWCSTSGRSVRQNAAMRESGTTVCPCVRGICSLISASTIFAWSAAALAASTLVPTVQLPCTSGGETWMSATSSGTSPVLNSQGISLRKIGTKSAQPSAIGLRHGAPVNSEFEKKRPFASGAT